MTNDFDPNKCARGVIISHHMCGGCYHQHICQVSRKWKEVREAIAIQKAIEEGALCRCHIACHSYAVGMYEGETYCKFHLLGAIEEEGKAYQEILSVREYEVTHRLENLHDPGTMHDILYGTGG